MNEIPICVAIMISFLLPQTHSYGRGKNDFLFGVICPPEYHLKRVGWYRHNDENPSNGNAPLQRKALN